MKTNRIPGILIAALLLLAGAAFAHQSKEVGEGAYRVSVGLLVNPAYTGQLNGIDLIIRDTEGEPVEHLERSLTAIVIAADGSELVLTLRAQSDNPGAYTGDFIPTLSGDMQVRVSGFIGSLEFEELFDQVAHSDPVIIDSATISLP